MKYALAVEIARPPADRGTRLTLVGEAEPGTLFGLAGPLVRRAAERRTRGDFERLRAVLEARL